MIENTKKNIVENLSLAPGYRAEQEDSVVYLVDPEGRRVAQLPPALISGIRHESGYRERAEKTSSPSEGWRELCQVLLARIYQQTLENEVLGKRVEQLEERLGAAEDERDQANAIAENLYQNFREHVRRVRRRKQSSRSSIGERLG